MDFFLSNDFSKKGGNIRLIEKTAKAAAAAAETAAAKTE